MADLERDGARLYEHVMAPLVLGGPLVPGHALGARAALALGGAGEPRVDPALVERVQAGRVRRARALAPVDVLGPPTAAEWALAAALHDALCAANPGFASALRRGAAARILDVALTTLDRVEPPARVGDALSRHSWLARLFEVTRTDAEVSWWTGSRVYRGRDVPARLRLWPDLRRVTVTTTARRLLELEPLGVRREKLVEVVRRTLARSPLTDLATCTRPEPEFAWTDAALALSATRAGRTLALRALARQPAADVAEALGRATAALEGPRLGVARELMAARGALAGAAPGDA